MAAETVDVPSRTLLSIQTGAKELGPDRNRAALEYVRDYHTINPRVAPLLAMPMGTWMHCHEHFDEAFVANDRFYQEYVPVYEMRFGSGMIVPLGERTVATVALTRSHVRGPLDAEERQWLQRLGEHLRESLQAYERMRTLAARAIAGHTLLSTFPYPMWLMDAERFVTFSNDPAEREHHSEERIVLLNSRIRLRDSAADRSLTLALTKLSSGGHGAKLVLPLEGHRSSPPAWLHLSMLIPHFTLSVFGDQPQILATLFDPLKASALDPFALANVFRLTPAEAKVATQIAEGLTVAEIAGRHGTSVRTIRSQLSQVLQKIGVPRQADLVRILRQGEALWSRARTGGPI